MSVTIDINPWEEMGVLPHSGLIMFLHSALPLSDGEQMRSIFSLIFPKDGVKIEESFQALQGQRLTNLIHLIKAMVKNKC